MSETAAGRRWPQRRQISVRRVRSWMAQTIRATPIAAPIAFLPIKNIPGSTVGRISSGDANYAIYREHLRRTIDEPFALFFQG